MAYLALAAEATDVTTRMSKEAGALYLRSRILNFEDRKTELIKFFAKALSHFAELVLIENLPMMDTTSLILWQMFSSTNSRTSLKHLTQT